MVRLMTPLWNLDEEGQKIPGIGDGTNILCASILASVHVDWSRLSEDDTKAYSYFTYGYSREGSAIVISY